MKFIVAFLAAELLFASCKENPAGPESPPDSGIQIKTEYLRSDKDEALVIIGDLSLSENTTGVRSYGVCWSESELPAVSDQKRSFIPSTDRITQGIFG